MSFSYSSVWDETARTVRGNSSLLLAVAGVFIFLPSLLAGYLAPPPQTQTLQTMMQHYNDNIGIIAAAQIVAFVGNLAILILVLDASRPTVGGSIRAAMPMLPAYLLVSILSGFMLMIGFFLLIIPFFYLLGRLATTGPVLVSEGRRNPFDIIKRSFEVTKGNGWAVVGLILLVFVGFYVLMLAMTFVFGSIFLVIDRATGGSVGALLLLVLSSAVGAAFNVVLMVLVASIYRRLSAGSQASVPPTKGI